MCTTRAYGFAGNARTNRTQQATATAEPGAPCPTVALETTATYDSADRLTNPGWVYDPLGRVTTMPDAGGGASVANGYFVNDLVASQTQPGTSRVTWELDPIQRRTTNTIEAWVNDAWASSVTKVSHYATDSDEPTWIAEDTTLPSNITRYVSGVEGDLAVTTDETGALELQLVDLHGDVVGTIPITDKTAPATWEGLVFTRTDEFGNPTPLTGAATPTGPPRYGWLGAAQRSGEALGGVILMGVRLYHPTTGRFLSVDPVAGGSANAYDYCNADPVNCTDLAGTFSFKGLLKAVAVVGEVASIIPGPIGAAAAGVSALAYAADGNTIKALEMGASIAASLVGAGLVAGGAQTRQGGSHSSEGRASRPCRNKGGASNNSHWSENAARTRCGRAIRREDLRTREVSPAGYRAQSSEEPLQQRQVASVAHEGRKQNCRHRRKQGLHC